MREAMTISSHEAKQPGRGKFEQSTQSQCGALKNCANPRCNRGVAADIPFIFKESLVSRLPTRILSVALAACMGLSAMAVQAQPRRDDDRHDRGQHRGQQRREQPRWDAHPGPGGHWQRGNRMAPEYRTQHYVVNDWRAHRLSAPPRGYQWVQNGSDFVLVAIATGVIASVVLGAMR
jgi:Ni/Co efflux regulator RcnB